MDSILVTDGSTAAACLVSAVDAAIAALDAGRPGSALQALSSAQTALATGQAHPFDVANVAVLQVRALRLAGRLDEAIVAAEKACAACDVIGRGRGRAGSRLLVQARLEWADALRAAGRYPQAGPLLHDAVRAATAELGPGDGDTGSAWNSLGVWHRYRGDAAPALAAYHSALAITTAVCGEQSPEVASVLHNIASLHHMNGDPAAAEPAARTAVAIREAAYGADHPDLAADLGVLGVVLADLGRLDEAGRCYSRARQILTGAAEPCRTELAYLACNEAALTHLRGDHAGANREYVAAERACRVALGARHPQVAAVLLNRAVLAADTGHPAVATRLAAACEQLLGGVVPAGHPHRLAAQALLADLARAG